MAQQLPLYQIPMPSPQAVAQGYNQPPLQMPQQQVVADVSPQTMAVAGVNKGGVDWIGALGTLGSYLSAAGSGMAGQKNIAAGLANAANSTRNLQQNIRQYDTMKPYYQQMGYDVSRLDPRRGGAGVASTPEKMIELQSLIKQREYLDEYRRAMAEGAQQRAEQKQQSMQTVGDLMLFNPEFRNMMNAQYDFRGGRNADILKRPVSKEALQSLMPKNVNMRYSGGLSSSKNVKVENTYKGAGKGSSANKKLIF